MSKILIIEDDRDISTLIKMNLEYSGYIIEQDFYGSTNDETLKNSIPDLIILDLNLPKISGLELLPLFVKYRIPVLILSARDSIQQKVSGLELGAEDYMVKPFEPLELIARVKTILRRKNNNNIYYVGSLQLNRDSKTVLKNNTKVNLTYTEYKILELLILNRGRLFSRSKLLEKIWGYDSNCDTRTVDMHITRLRSKVGQKVIKTVFKEGYIIEE